MIITPTYSEDHKHENTIGALQKAVEWVRPDHTNKLYCR